MKGPWLPAAVLLILGVLSGCKSTATPNWTHPGSDKVQVKRATRFDPYPEPQTGTTMAGDRPRDYQAPVDETSRSRWVLDKSPERSNADRWKTDGTE